MGRFTFRFEAGVFIRGQVKREVEKGAFDAGLQLELRESKGLLESTYFATVTGPDLKVLAFSEAAKKFFKDNGAVEEE